MKRTRALRKPLVTTLVAGAAAALSASGCKSEVEFREPCGGSSCGGSGASGSSSTSPVGPSTSSGTPPCPAEKPAKGAPCQEWEDGPACLYPAEEPCGGLEAEAVCTAGSWQILEPLCNPPAPQYCFTIDDPDACEAEPICSWLLPGCGTPPLAEAGCHPDESCETAPWICDVDMQCHTFSVDPCWNQDCGTCDEARAVCVYPDAGG